MDGIPDLAVADGGIPNAKAKAITTVGITGEDNRSVGTRTGNPIDCHEP